MTPSTLFEKVWNSHVVRAEQGQPDLLYIDLHLVHEVTSPQAFESLDLQRRKVRRPDLTVATIDHNVPTQQEQRLKVLDNIAAAQMAKLRENCAKHGIRLFDVDSPQQGIVHVIGPELGLCQPGMIIVCGDSHTSTHGAFGALAFGIGTSEVEHVLATQCLSQQRPKSMNVEVTGGIPSGVTAKDIALGIISEIGMDGGTGHVIEYSGKAIRSLSMEGRMTLCNMSIESGARAGMIAPDDATFAYVARRPYAPKGGDWNAALDHWSKLKTDDSARFDRRVSIGADQMAPFVTWGTSPGMVTPVTGRVPDPDRATSAAQSGAWRQALGYMGLAPNMAIEDIAVDRIFIGSCTNARIEDLREAAAVLRGYKVHPRVKGIVVPGSYAVKRTAEAEGLDRVFLDAGLEWREPGCSMCLGMNPDIVPAGERCASTSNRNFEGRQGRDARTHLVSPAMAAAAAVYGHFTDVRGWTHKG